MAEQNSTIHAERDGKYYTRFLLMGVGALLFLGWCLKDGLYSYPLQKVQYEKYTELVDEGRGGEWEQLAADNGWSAEVPDERTDGDILLQFVMGGLSAVVGIWMLSMVWLSRGRWIESDGKQIVTSWGETVPFDAVVSIDKKKWAKKGIAFVQYEDGGKTKRFVLDDFKFVRKPTDEILVLLEQAVGTDKITGGPPEAIPGSEVEAPEGDVAAEQAVEPQA